MDHGKKIFPLRDAYVFADQQGLSAEGAAIRDMEIEWDRPYASEITDDLIVSVARRSRRFSCAL
jgi:hypothetical protein